MSQILKMAVDASNLQRAFERVCDTFKIPSLYDEQKECRLEPLFNGKDVYASLPTGYGKSLIFYAAPIVVACVEGAAVHRLAITLTSLSILL